MLITVCRSGKRSVAAAIILEAAGYRTINGWVNDGLPYSYSGDKYQD